MIITWESNPYLLDTYGATRCLIQTHVRTLTGQCHATLMLMTIKVVAPKEFHLPRLLSRPSRWECDEILKLTFEFFVIDLPVWSEQAIAFGQVGGGGPSISSALVAKVGRPHNLQFLHQFQGWSLGFLFIFNEKVCLAKSEGKR